MFFEGTVIAAQILITSNILWRSPDATSHTQSVRVAVTGPKGRSARRETKTFVLRKDVKLFSVDTFIASRSKLFTSQMLALLASKNHNVWSNVGFIYSFSKVKYV